LLVLYTTLGAFTHSWWKVSRVEIEATLSNVEQLIHQSTMWACHARVTIPVVAVLNLRQNCATFCFRPFVPWQQFHAWQTISAIGNMETNCTNDITGREMECEDDEDWEKVGETDDDDVCTCNTGDLTIQMSNHKKTNKKTRENESPADSSQGTRPVLACTLSKDMTDVREGRTSRDLARNFCPLPQCRMIRMHVCIYYCSIKHDS
jgi:hypothetical protein